MPESAKNETRPVLPRGACVLLLNRQGQVLSVSRPWKDTFGLPGGKRDPGETPKQNASRELLEETGVFVPESDLVPINQGVCEAEPGGGARTHFVDVFSAPLSDGHVARQVEDGIRVEWLAPKDLLDKAAFPVHLKGILTKAGLL